MAWKRFAVSRLLRLPAALSLLLSLALSAFTPIGGLIHPISAAAAFRPSFSASVNLSQPYVQSQTNSSGATASQKYNLQDGTVTYLSNGFANAGPGGVGASARSTADASYIQSGQIPQITPNGDSSATATFNDITFSGPQGTDVNASLNLTINGSVLAVAQDNPDYCDCGIFAQATADVTGSMGSAASGACCNLRFSGHEGYDSTGAVAQSGLFGTFPTPGGSAEASTPTGTFAVGYPYFLTVSLEVTSLAVSGGTVYLCGAPGGNASQGCGIGSAEHVDGGALFGDTVTLPTSGPVFNLPPGYSVNAPSAGIVDNHFVGQDTSAPTTQASITPAPNSAGWNNSNVTVSLSSTDPDGTADVAEVDYSATGANPTAATAAPGSAASFTISAEGNTTLTYFAKDRAGNTESAHNLTIHIDKTAPTITFAGNAGSYAVDQTVNITCSAADPLSGGVASGIDQTRTSCPSASGPAYSFAVGTNTLTATAVDLAGNSATANASFNVQVTYGGLCNLTMTFIESSAKFQALPQWLQAVVSQYGTAGCLRLAAANIALTSQQKATAINAYQQLVAGLVPVGWLTQDQANTLTRLSNDL